MTTSRTDWFITQTGIEFSPLDPNPRAIRIADIAHSLSHICRFNGHCDWFYSVAQHSILVSRAVAQLGGGREAQLWGLLHDATEAYLGDVMRPLKVQPEFDFYRLSEQRVEMAIIERFMPFRDVPSGDAELVKIADEGLLFHELRHVHTAAYGRDLKHEHPLHKKETSVRRPKFYRMSIYNVRARFLKMFRTLGGQG